MDEIQVVRKVVYDRKYVCYDFVIGDFVLRLNIRRYQKREAGSKLFLRWEGFY